MKSPQLANLGMAGNPNYSELKVLKSAAGYYVGTEYRVTDKEGNVLYTEPGSRDSGYFATEETARRFLAYIEANEDNLEAVADDLRLTP